MVNLCGHALCENCVDLLFVKGSGQCPTCEITLRKGNFRYQIFQDSFIEKEVDIRKKILKDFNKKEEDFDSLREYNDYLEDVEEIIYNLANDIDIESTKRRIEIYKKDNADFISKNRGKKSKDEIEIEEQLEKEKELALFRKTHSGILSEVEEMTRFKNKAKESLVDQLMFSELPANQILQSHSDAAKKEIEAQKIKVSQREEQERQLLFHIQQRDKQGGKFSTGIQFGRASNVFQGNVSSSSQVPDEPYVYEPQVLDLNGPPCPSIQDLESRGYLSFIPPASVSESAGGFNSIYPCLRSLQEAFCGLYFTPE